MMSMETLKRIVCAVWGHSDLLTGCFGYMYCSRCGEQVGDTLAGAYQNNDCVIVGHGCDTCRTNWARMGWRSKFLAGKPELENEVTS